MTGFLVAWWVLHWRGTSWKSLGLAMPAPLWRAAVLTIALYLVEMAVSQWVIPALAQVFQPTQRPSFLGHLRGNVQALVFWLAISWLVGGICEECLFRGFLLDRIETLLGGGRAALAIAAIAQALFFGSLHLYGGTFAFMYAAIFGLLYAVFYLLARRNLWPVIIVHAVRDCLAFWSVYSS